MLISAGFRPTLSLSCGSLFWALLMLMKHANVALIEPFRNLAVRVFYKKQIDNCQLDSRRNHETLLTFYSTHLFCSTLSWPGNDPVAQSTWLSDSERVAISNPGFNPGRTTWLVCVSELAWVQARYRAWQVEWTKSVTSSNEGGASLHSHLRELFSINTYIYMEQICNCSC